MISITKKIKGVRRKLLGMKKIPDLGQAFLHDYYKWLKYSLSINATNTTGKQKAILLMNLHAIEKGLSFKKAKNGFGKEKVLKLITQTENHLRQHGTDSLGLAALGVLNQYIQHPQSGKNDYIVKQFQTIADKYQVHSDSLIGGIKPINKESVSSDLSYERLYQFAAVRHSVRNFSDADVTEEQILQAVKFAQTAPSVCNRQTARVHVFEKEAFEPIVNAQLGDQGWVKNANKLFIITTDMNFFGGMFERNQAYIEGGLFSMQFVMGLHAQKIASCCKMYIRSQANDKAVYKATGIPENEVLIMLILAGHYEDETVKVPYSFRFPTEDIVNFHLPI